MGKLAGMEQLSAAKLQLNAEEQAIEARAISPAVQALNDKAEFEIWGSAGAPVLGNLGEVNNVSIRQDNQGKGNSRLTSRSEFANQSSLTNPTWLNPETGEALAPQAGKLAEIMSNRAYGKTQPERERAADHYLNGVLSLVDNGFELSQAKLVMDLREKDQDKIGQLAGKYISKGESPLLATEKAIDAYGNLDERRLDLIKRSGAFSREEYDNLMAKKNNHQAKTVGQKAVAPVTRPESKPAAKAGPTMKVVPQAESEPASVPMPRIPKQRKPVEDNFSEKAKPVETAAEAKAVERLNIKFTIGQAFEQDDRHEHMEDTILRDDKLGLFGVFDGLGGEPNGDKASQAAAASVNKHYKAYNSPAASTKEAGDRIQHALEGARKSVNGDAGKGGDTTGVFGKLENINGKSYLVWANAGDSRLFMQNGETAAIEPLSSDQSYGNVVHNTISGKYQSTPDEFGVVELKPGARIMFCSDGITGDWEHQLLTDAEFAEGFAQSTAQASADKFLALSKKIDDKSVLVIDINELSAKPAADEAEVKAKIDELFDQVESDQARDNAIEHPANRRGKLITIIGQAGDEFTINGDTGEIYKRKDGNNEPIATLDAGEALPEIVNGKPYILLGKNKKGEEQVKSLSPVTSVSYVKIPEAVLGASVEASSSEEPEIVMEQETAKRDWRKTLKTRFGQAKQVLKKLANGPESEQKPLRKYIARSLVGATAVAALTGGLIEIASNEHDSTYHSNVVPKHNGDKAGQQKPGEVQRPIVKHDKAPKLSYRKTKDGKGNIAEYSVKR